VKHYFHPMSRAVTTDWMLKELDAPHEQIVVDFPTGENNTTAYRSINPMGKIPTLVDDGVVVTETAAICAYLADKFSAKGLAPSQKSTERARYYRYLFFPGTTLEPMFTFKQLGHADPDPKSTGWGDQERCLATVETMTPESRWALGEEFTAADVVFGGTLDFAMQFGWLKKPSERVNAYVQRLRQRPAYRASHPESWYQ